MGQAGAPPPGRSKFETPDVAMNTVCFQAHQSMYNPSPSMFDIVIKNTGKGLLDVHSLTNELRTKHMYSRMCP